MELLSFKSWIKSLLVKPDRYAYLKKYPILAGFTQYELFLLSQILQERKFKENEVVYGAQNPLAVIYLIASGSIEIDETANGQNIKTTLHKHQFLGIIDMYNENRRKGIARAVKDSTLLAVSHLDFQAFIKANPKTGVKLLNNICAALSHYIVNQSFSRE